jgi:hypothetical protein
VASTIIVSIIGSLGLAFAAWLGRKVVQISVNVNHRLDQTLDRLEAAHAQITTSQTSGNPVPADQEKSTELGRYPKK